MSSWRFSSTESPFDGNRVLLARGGGFPLGHGFPEFLLAAGELMVERGVEIRVAGAGDQFGQCRRAGLGIGESFPERVIIGEELERRRETGR